jgi:hypothetical protein
MVRDGSCAITERMYFMIGGAYHFVMNKPSNAAIRTCV